MSPRILLSLASVLALTSAAAFAAPSILSPTEMGARLGTILLKRGGAARDMPASSGRLIPPATGGPIDRARPRDAEGELRREAEERTKSNVQNQFGREKAAVDAKAAQGLGWGKLGIDLASKAADFVSAYKPLSPDDASLGPGSTPSGMPRVPSKCVEGSGCKGCYEKAYGDLNHLRFSFEKLRAIGKWTETFTTKSVAFGDSVSGVHGVAGLGWQPERAKILQSYATFGTAYDSKYRELVGDLEGALRGIGVCEARHFGTDDWYDRYGFIYYSFMADRYRR